MSEFDLFRKKKEERELKLAMQEIDRRAHRKEMDTLGQFATNDINPFNSFYLRHVKSLSYVALECFHATVFHFIETVKVRGMARNLKEDVSLYFKNQVEKKRKIYLFLSYNYFSFDFWSRQWFFGSSSRFFDLHLDIQLLNILLLRQ